MPLTRFSRIVPVSDSKVLTLRCTGSLYIRCADFVTTVPAHDDVIKWKHFPRYWPFVRGIHRSPVNSRHKGQWRGSLMFSLIYVWIIGWVNNGEAGDLRRHCAHYDVIVMGPLNIRSTDFVTTVPASTHLPLDKMAAISQTTFSNEFSWMKSFVFRFEFHWGGQRFNWQ